MKELKTLNSLAALLSTSELTLNSIVENRPLYYSSFKYKKADGSEREITPPKGELMRIQSALYRYLRNRVTFKKCVNGGVPHRSIITNARPHVGKDMLAKLDIRQFFPSTSEERVCDAFVGIGCEDSAARVLAGLTTFKNALPQGGPTSVFLGNLVLLKLDNDFLRLADRHGLSYTRFVDDITISANGKDLESFKAAFEGIILAHGYKPASGKTLFKPRSGPQIVTGLIVNDVLRPAPWFVRELKHAILGCWPKNEGVLRVAAANDCTVRELHASLNGKVSFVQSVDPKMGKSLYSLMCQILWPRVQDMSSCI
jgi:RNA-directed DNA polymerase